MKSQKTFKFSGKEGSYILPSQVRTFVETLSGNRDPITEKNFNKEELKQMRDAIARSQARQVRTQEGTARFFPEFDTSGYTPDPTVDYKDYKDKDKRLSFRSKLMDYSPLPRDAARNTLGRFKYEKTPEGRLVATDSYDFKDDLVSTNVHIPRSRDYEKLSTIEKISKLAKDTVASDNDKGGFSTLPSRIGSAFVGAASRPVRIDLGDADFKRGGKVKAKVQNTIRTQSSKRGDGIATKGFTKGKIK